MKRLLLLLCLLGLLCFALPQPTAHAQDDITPDRIINAYNQMRVARGLRPLVVDPILMQTAQETADLMALYHMTDHIGNVRGRVMAAGYGNGQQAWATENFAIGPMSFDFLLQVWSDDAHMIPAVNPNYRHIGAGIAEYDGSVYYILHAAYTVNGDYVAPTAFAATQDPNAMATLWVSQIVYPVQTSTPPAAGEAWTHTVRAGQSLWSIALAYDTHIADIARLNGISLDNPLIYNGQKLLLPTPLVQPEQVGLTATSPSTPALSPPPPDSPSQTPRPSPTRPPPTPTATLSSSPTAQPAPRPTTEFPFGAIIAGIAGLGLLLILIGLRTRR